MQFRLVGIMLQISIIILIWMSLETSSLCSILLFLSLWFYHYSSFINKWLNTLAIYKTFPHSITPLSLSSWSLTSSKSLMFPTSSTPYQRYRWAYFAIFSPLFLYFNYFVLTYYAQYFTWIFNILLKVQLYCQLLNSAIMHMYSSTAAVNTHHGQP